MTKLDPIDRKILSLLTHDARQPIEKLAEAVGLSQTPVRRRIKRLQTQGLIQRYTIDVDLRRAGYPLQLYAFIKLQSRDQESLEQFESKLQTIPEVSACALVTGAHDYLLTLQMPSMDAYNLFLRSVLAELPGVFGIESSVIIGEVKPRTRLPF